jgi:hypothetical protein
MSRTIINRPVQLNVMPVYSLKANTFPEGVGSAMEKLEKKLLDAYRSKIFGAISFKGSEVEYRACVSHKPADENSEEELENYQIPGGQYMSSRLLNWMKNTHLIKEIFNEMEKKYLFDQSRPQLEFYKSKRELVLLLPVKPKATQLKLDF